MAFSGSERTRHGPAGWAARPVGSFAGKEEGVASRPTVGPFRHGFNGWVTQGVTFVAKEPAAPEPEVDAGVDVGAVWLAGARRRRMERLRREAAEARTKRIWKKKRRDEAHMAALAELQEVFTEAAALDLPPDTADAISEPVAKYAVQTFDGRVIPASMVDWRELALDYAAVRDLTHNLLQAADYVSDAEDLEIAMFMMMAMQ